VTQLMRQKRRLVLETPYVIRGRAVIVHVGVSGLTLREKGCRAGLEISLGTSLQPRGRDRSGICAAGKAKLQTCEKSPVSRVANLTGKRSRVGPYTSSAGAFHRELCPAAAQRRRRFGTPVVTLKMEAPSVGLERS